MKFVEPAYNKYRSILGWLFKRLLTRSAPPFLLWFDHGRDYKPYSSSPLRDQFNSAFVGAKWNKLNAYIWPNNLRTYNIIFSLIVTTPLFYSYYSNGYSDLIKFALLSLLICVLVVPILLFHVLRIPLLPELHIREYPDHINDWFNGIPQRGEKSRHKVFRPALFDSIKWLIPCIGNKGQSIFWRTEGSAQESYLVVATIRFFLGKKTKITYWDSASILRIFFFWGYPAWTSFAVLVLLPLVITICDSQCGIEITGTGCTIDVENCSTISKTTLMKTAMLWGIFGTYFFYIGGRRLNNILMLNEERKRYLLPIIFFNTLNRVGINQSLPESHSTSSIIPSRFIHIYSILVAINTLLLGFYLTYLLAVI